MPEVSDKKTGLAIVLIVIGSVLMLDKLHLLYLPWYIFSWPSLIILFGVLLIAFKNQWEAGVLFITVGTAFLLPKIFYISFRDLWTYWPVLLIVVGIVMLVRHMEGPKNYHNKNND
ncbi:MAG: DUF5668 domain-containing protein [Cyclobacteriaceae bacterium]|nr:DUF5668 domain-containing protein [Cyclobacteriaceae bacterium]